MKDSSVGAPEPLPDWTKGEGPVVWKWALPIHSYIFGAVFFTVAAYGVYNLFRLWQTRARRSKNYFICITLLISTFGLTRAIVLLADPYLTARPLHLAPAYGLLLFSLGYPCLTSGFFLINWSLVVVTKLQLIPSLIHKRKVLAPVVIVHFVVVITFDTVFVLVPRTHILLFICRSFFVFWGFLLFGGFIAAAVRIQRQVQRTLRNFTQTKMITANNQLTSRGRRRNNSTHLTAPTNNDNMFQEVRTRRVMKISRRAAASGLLICCTQIYALWEFYVFYNDHVIPKAWPWWIYQTCFRCIELFMVSQMFLIVQPRK